MSCYLCVQDNSYKIYDNDINAQSKIKEVSKAFVNSAIDKFNVIDDGDLDDPLSDLDYSNEEKDEDGSNSPKVKPF